MAHRYSNPVKRLEVDNWPSGRYQTTAIFEIETTKYGERATRTTIHPQTGQPCQAKKDTYGSRVRIVTGDNGRTYILRLSSYGGHITVMQGNLQFQEEAIFDGDPRFAEVAALLAEEV